MLEMKIHDKACRGCKLCLDICPTDCFSFDEEKQKAVVEKVVYGEEGILAGIKEGAVLIDFGTSIPARVKAS